MRRPFRLVSKLKQVTNNGEQSENHSKCIFKKS